VWVYIEVKPTSVSPKIEARRPPVSSPSALPSVTASVAPNPSGRDIANQVPPIAASAPSVAKLGGTNRGVSTRQKDQVQSARSASGSASTTSASSAQEVKLSPYDRFTINTACNTFQVNGDKFGYQECLARLEYVAINTPEPSMKHLPVELHHNIRTACASYQSSGDLEGHRRCMREKIGQVRITRGPLNLPAAATSAD